MRLFGSAGGIAVLAATAAACSSDNDCNAQLCLDCKCNAGSCACADGWSGDACQTPFCTNSSQCSDHGSCVMTLHNITCECDQAHTGDRCQTAECQLQCVHGGAPDANCTTCEGCLPGWEGPQCNDFTNSSSASDLVKLYQGECLHVCSRGWRIEPACCARADLASLLLSTCTPCL